jgi:hypothetical protein
MAPRLSLINIHMGRPEASPPVTRLRDQGLDLSLFHSEVITNNGLLYRRLNSALPQSHRQRLGAEKQDKIMNNTRENVPHCILFCH